MKVTTKLWVTLGVLVILSPLGLILPAHFRSTGAWGEWCAEEVRELVGYIPRGLERLGGIWNAPIPDYAFRGWEKMGLPMQSIAYIVSAIVGVAITAAIAFLLGRLLAKK